MKQIRESSKRRHLYDNTFLGDINALLPSG